MNQNRIHRAAEKTMIGVICCAWVGLFLALGCGIVSLFRSDRWPLTDRIPLAIVLCGILAFWISAFLWIITAHKAK